EAERRSPGQPRAGRASVRSRTMRKKANERRFACDFSPRRLALRGRAQTLCALGIARAPREAPKIPPFAQRSLTKGDTGQGSSLSSGRSVRGAHRNGRRGEYERRRGKYARVL